jgi:hypothetical protein
VVDRNHGHRLFVYDCLLDSGTRALTIFAKAITMRSPATVVGVMIVSALSWTSSCWTSSGWAEEPSTPIELFEQRIMPIFRSPQPSSCVQCHLSSVDLKDYILPSSEATFHALRTAGLINVGDPQSSKILTLIEMGEQDRDRGAALIHAKTRQAEYEAFTTWIIACCQDPELLARDSASQSASTAGPQLPLTVIRHARKDRLLDSFVRNIWSQRMRCFPCHTPHEIDPMNPKHQMPKLRHAEYVEQYGQKMNLFRATPDETLRAWLASSRKASDKHLPLVNAEAPQHSLIVLKPTGKLPAKRDDGTFEEPSSNLPVSHMGGLKMHVNDQSYKSFISWIEDYAQVARGEYVSEDQLPDDNWYPTEHVLRIKGTPENWPKLSTVQLFVFAWSEEASAWESQPIAFTQALVARVGW